jgi:hypothetical protein
MAIEKDWPPETLRILSSSHGGPKSLIILRHALQKGEPVIYNKTILASLRLRPSDHACTCPA